MAPRLTSNAPVSCTCHRSPARGAQALPTGFDVAAPAGDREMPVDPGVVDARGAARCRLDVDGLVSSETPENEAALGWQPVTIASTISARTPSQANGRSIRTGTDRSLMPTHRS